MRRSWPVRFAYFYTSSLLPGCVSAMDPKTNKKGQRFVEAAAEFFAPSRKIPL